MQCTMSYDSDTVIISLNTFILEEVVSELPDVFTVWSSAFVAEME